MLYARSSIFIVLFTKQNNGQEIVLAPNVTGIHTGRSYAQFFERFAFHGRFTFYTGLIEHTPENPRYNRVLMV